MTTESKNRIYKRLKQLVKSFLGCDHPEMMSWGIHCGGEMNAYTGLFCPDCGYVFSDDMPPAFVFDLAHTSWYRKVFED